MWLGLSEAQQQRVCDVLGVILEATGECLVRLESQDSQSPSDWPFFGVERAVSGALDVPPWDDRARQSWGPETPAGPS